jgi:hypothetical protein
MDYNYTLKYRKFTDLLSDVQMDLKSFDLDGSIKAAELIKVATRVSYDLGLRIHTTKQTILELNHHKVKLPDGFKVMNYALICGEYQVSTVLPQGTNIEAVVPKYTPMGNPESHTNIQKVCMQWNKEQPELIQRINTETRTYKFMHQIRFIKSKFIDCDCPNLSHMTRDEAYIKDGFIHANIDCANLYINFEGELEDEEGNLLVPDHPLLNEYYEYAIKQRILENAMMNGDNVTAQIQLVESRYKIARTNALSMVNTPNFSEMYAVWTMNRKAQYSKYYDMFKSNPDYHRLRGYSVADINRAV